MANRTVGTQVVLGAIVAAVGGCGSSLKNPNGPDSVVDACQQLQEANAQFLARCVGGSVADWRDYYQSFQDCTATPGHLLAGRAEYHPELFAACLAQFQGPCDQGGPSYCPFDVIKGTVPDGQPCQDLQVCGTDSTCFDVGGGACGAVCARLGVENEACGFHCGDASPCLEFEYCAGDLACVSNVCVKSQGPGAACGPGNPVPCSRLLKCTADPADPLSTGTCQPRTTGGACHVDTDCPDTDFCLQGACAVRRTEGQLCSDGPTGCVAWTTCDAATGTCVPAGKPGFPCYPYPGSEIGYCWVGVCSADNVCVDYANPGESCAGGNLCALGSSCDLGTLMCVACRP